MSNFILMMSKGCPDWERAWFRLGSCSARYVLARFCDEIDSYVPLLRVWREHRPPHRLSPVTPPGRPPMPQWPTEGAHQPRDTRAFPLGPSPSAGPLPHSPSQGLHQCMRRLSFLHSSHECHVIIQWSATSSYIATRNAHATQGTRGTQPHASTILRDTDHDHRPTDLTSRFWP